MSEATIWRHEDLSATSESESKSAIKNEAAVRERPQRHRFVFTTKALRLELLSQYLMWPLAIPNVAFGTRGRLALQRSTYPRGTLTVAEQLQYVLARHMAYAVGLYC